MKPTIHEHKLLRLIVLLFAGLALSRPAWAGGYTITDLGTLGGTYSFASSINNSGQVVGNAAIAGDVASHAFLYTNGVMADIGTLGGKNSMANSINNHGQVVGYGLTTGNSTLHAFLYSNGVLTDINQSGFNYSVAYGINDTGQVTGGASDLYGGKPFLYSNGVMTALGFKGVASAINTSGEIAGTFSAEKLGGSGDYSFLYTNGMITNLGMLGSPYNDSSNGFGINDLGQVVGDSRTAQDRNGYLSYHAMLSSNGIMTDLGTLGGTKSSAYSINNAGQVVGVSSLLGDTGYGAFLYEGGIMKVLNSLIDPSSGWNLTDARDINDLGQIIGAGTINGHEHAFLMTPTTVVPLPPAAWLLGSGLLGLVGVARKHKEV